MAARKICLIGSNNLIQKHFQGFGLDVYQYGRSSSPPLDFTQEAFKASLISLVNSNEFSLYIIASGYLQSEAIVNQHLDDISKSFLVNAAGPVVASELILKNDSTARIFIIGSESGRKGSFDMSYALSKCSLSVYVENRSLSPGQQLLLFRPSTIRDLGMTIRRQDKNRLQSYIDSHPKRRFLECFELSELMMNVFNSSIYLTNAIIDVNGGKFANS